jgi:general secretion pathway protein L
MAAKTLRRGEAIVWLPPRSGGESALRERACFTALLGGEPAGAARRLSLEALKGVRALWLVLDPRDCTLMSLVLPPLSGARLAQALPNAVEDQLLQDVSECVIALAPAETSGAPRRLAVADREWIDVLLQVFEQRGHRIQAIWPAAEALPKAESAESDWTLACVGEALTLRMSADSALGWPAPESPTQRLSALHSLVQAARLMRPAPLPTGTLQAWMDDPQWTEPLQVLARDHGLQLSAAPLQPAFDAAIDLLGAVPGRARRLWSRIDARALRLPVGLVLACVLSALIGLNLHWWQLLSERNAVRAGLEAAFRAAVPSAQVVVDPLLQMTRHVDALRTASGQAGAQDALPLLSRFAEALGPSATDALLSAEYREGRLRVRFRPERVDSRALRDQLREACARSGLLLRFDNEREATATVGVQG